MNEKMAAAYHSVERIQWVRRLACVVPGCETRPAENHHTRAGGMGMKAHYSTIVPLCHHHHQQLHTIGVLTFERRYGLDLAQEAAAVQTRWEEKHDGR